MPDVTEHASIDDVASHAVATLRRDASARPMPELRLRTTRRWAAPAMAIAVVVVVILGLVAIGTNHDGAVTNKPLNLHWLLRNDPGWSPTSAFESATAPPRDTSPDLLPIIYVTDAAPLGPTLSVQGTTDTTQGWDLGSFSVNATDYSELTINGRRAAFVNVSGGSRGLYVEIDGAWAYLSATGLTDDDLVALAKTLAPDPTGRFDIDASSLPTGLHKVAPSGDPAADYIVVNYVRTGDTNEALSLSVGPRTRDGFGRLSVGAQFISATVDDAPGYIADVSTVNQAPASSWLVLWRRDGLDFALSGTGVSREQALAAAASASPASSDEWAQLIGSQADAPADTVTRGTAPPDARTTTQPALTAAPRDVDITVNVDDVSDNDQRWSGVLPTGRSWSAEIVRVYDKLTIRYSLDGSLVSDGGTSLKPPLHNQLLCCQPLAITANPLAVAMRVLLANGDRYSIPLHELPGTDGVRVALITIADPAPHSVELVDANDNVLESDAPG